MPDFIFSKEKNCEIVIPSKPGRFTGTAGPVSIYAAPYTKMTIDQYTPVHFGFYALHDNTKENQKSIELNTYSSDFGLMYLISANQLDFKDLLQQSYSIIKNKTIDSQKNHKYLDVDDFMLVWNMSHVLPDHYLVFLGSGELEFSWPLYVNMKAKKGVAIVAQADCRRPLLPEQGDYQEFIDKWDGSPKDLKTLFTLTQTLTNNNYFSVLERAAIEKKLSPANSESGISKI